MQPSMKDYLWQSYVHALERTLFGHTTCSAHQLQHTSDYTDDINESQPDRAGKFNGMME